MITNERAISIANEALNILGIRDEDIRQDAYLYSLEHRDDPLIKAHLLLFICAQMKVVQLSFDELNDLLTKWRKINMRITKEMPAQKIRKYSWFRLDNEYFLKIGESRDGFISAIRYNNGVETPVEVNQYKLVTPVMMKCVIN